MVKSDHAGDREELPAEDHPDGDSAVDQAEDVARNTTLTVGPDDFLTREEVRSFLADSPRPHSTDYGETTVAPYGEHEERVFVRTTRLKDLEELVEHDEFRAVYFQFEGVYGSQRYEAFNGEMNRHWGGDAGVFEEEHELSAGGVVITKTSGNLRVAPDEAEDVLTEWGIEVDDIEVDEVL